MTDLANEVDKLTNRPSETRFLQVYPIDSMLAAHHDRGLSSKIVGLSGIGLFTIHDPTQHDIPIMEIPIGQGDVLHYFGNGLHSAANVSPIEDRFTLNLIDIQK